MEVLLELEGCRRPLKVTKEDVIEQVFDTAKYIIPGVDVTQFTFRRFSTKFNRFVDVCSPEDVEDGDTATLNPKSAAPVNLQY